MEKGNYIKTILRSKKTVFTIADIALLWGDSSTNATRVRLNYYVRSGQLYRIRRGLYGKDRDYDKLELATRIFTPAYVSFETVLSRAGIVFQYYERIFVATYLTRAIVCDGRAYEFRKIKNTILTDPSGIEHKGEYSVATAERAFLDTIYLHADYHFDSLASLDWNRVFELLPIYDNQRMKRRIDQLHKHLKAGET
jgi:predicted transcriptional regulator of viral defense system